MIVTETIGLSTRGDADTTDITSDVARAVHQSGLEAGTVTIFVPGSTGGVTTAEYEPGLVADLEALWEKLVPRDKDYQHNLRWGDGNGHSHLRAALVGASLTVPFARKSLLLGTWQQIVFIDFDNRPRSRELVVQIMGE
ncbi:MAG: secondary thiamine-phosphate synthase enzyme YjbQ [Dehalococcoidia bacterium]